MNDKMTWLVEYLRRNGAMSAEEVIQEAADAMKAQAERIKVLELDLDVQAGSIEAVQAVNTRQAERIEALEAAPQVGYFYKWKEAMHGIARLMDERDTLRAQLAEIAATEPVAYRWVWKSKPWDIEGWCYTNTPPTLPELQEIEPLFTRPMPAQDVTELVEALEKLARLGNGEHYGNSDGNMIARAALSSYKGVK